MNEYCVAIVIDKNIAIKNKPIAINMVAVKVAILSHFVSESESHEMQNK